MVIKCCSLNSGHSASVSGLVSICTLFKTARRFVCVYLNIVHITIVTLQLLRVLAPETLSKDFDFCLATTLVNYFASYFLPFAGVVIIVIVIIIVVVIISLILIVCVCVCP